MTAKVRRGLNAEVSVELEVPFHDVDMLRVVWHGHYYKYFEVARTALLRKYQLDGQSLLDTGYMFLVIESHCRHVSPLKFGDKFRVGAAFKDLEFRLNMAFEIHNLTHDRRVAYGYTTLATIDREGQLMLRTPDVIRSRIGG